MRRAVAFTVASLCAALLGGLAAPAAAAGQGGPLSLDARIDGQVVGDGNLVIDPTREATIDITVRNETNSLQRVKTVRLSGTALALTFFSYDTTVAFDVPAGGVERRSFPLDLADLDSQATGLLPATVQLLAPDRTVLAEVAATSDVRGSVWSVFGSFGIAVVVLTLLAWVGALVSLARGTLPANRWRRALRFLPAGFGTGLSAVITLSVLRLVAPAPAAEVPLVLGAAAAALLLGYLTPHPAGAVPAETDAGQLPAGATSAHLFTAHQGPTGQLATDYLPGGRPGYLDGQLPPGLQPPPPVADPSEQVTEAHRVPVPTDQPYPPPPVPPAPQPAQPAPPAQPAGGPLAAPAGQQVVRPRQSGAGQDAADPDLTVDANATIQAGLLSDFLDPPEGQR